MCDSTDDIPVDNGSIVNVHACNYCSEDIGTHYTSWGKCVLPDKLQERTKYYVDSNFASCCGVTNITSDCDIIYGLYFNSTEQQVCSERYGQGYLMAIINDGLGTAGVAFVHNLGLIVTVMILSVVIGAFAYYYGKVK